jgi:hypothetical protein
VRFIPLTPARLVEELAAWIRTTVLPSAVRPSLGTAGAPGGTVIGFDGPAEVGATDLADQVGEVLRSSGCPVVTASTTWWWRPSALRLELGRHDLDMLMTGWVDSEALTRELIGPVREGLPHLTRLRDPVNDRSVRQQYSPGRPGAVLLLDGPFLLAAGLQLDAVVGLEVGRGALGRALPPDRAWWAAGFERYRDEYEPLGKWDVVLAYDHPSAPAAAGLVGEGAGRR